MGHCFHGIIAGSNKSWAKKQVFTGITANGELWGEQQSNAISVSQSGGIDNFVGVAAHVTNHKIKLGNADFECHGPQE
jgi:hypothetical protein